VLHPDRRLWASWNIVTRERRQLVSYYLNRVQPLRIPRDLFLTLGDVPIDPARRIARFTYRHPIFDAASTASQPALARLNGLRGTYFCGSYTGHGFHEDAVASALRVGACFNLGLDAQTALSISMPSSIVRPTSFSSRRSAESAPSSVPVA
jgi:predicted NAD/FAD-binding protein